MSPLSSLLSILAAAFLLSTSMKRPIESNLFEAGGPDVRSFVCEATLQAPVQAVFRAWTSPEAFVRAYAPQGGELRVDMDLSIGGAYEWLFDGRTGSNGCQVLSYVPDRMLSFSWNAPPDQAASRAKHTWVVVEFEALSASSTKLRLTHLGFGSAPHWDETFAYFEKAWPYVFTQMRKGLEGTR